jgi:beta-phosphoglucomutase
MKYKAVLFDMDGVILDSEPLHVAAFQATLGRFGHELDMNGYEAHFAGKTDETGFNEYFDFINEDANIPAIMSEKAKKYLELAQDQLTPYPGIVQIIKELSEHVPLALVTGSLRSEVDVALKACGIEGQFSAIVTANDITKSKPNPEGYLKASELLGIEPKDCVVVEDSPSGINAAIAANIDCIAVTNTHSKEELKGATTVVEQLSFNLF